MNPLGPGQHTSTRSHEGAAVRTRIFRARRIVTLDGPEPEAFATLGGRVLATGRFDELYRRSPGAEVIDLEGGLVIPGFNDAHCHPSVTAQTRLRADVSPAAVGDLAGLHRVLSEQAARLPAGEWIFGSGYHPERTSGGRLDRAALDRVSPRHPIAIVLFNWHFAVVNSAALRLAGLDDTSPDPVGGQLGRDASGRLDGWLYEQAFLRPYFAGSAQQPWVRELSTASMVDALVAENQFLHSTGITSYCDAIVTPSTWRMFQTAHAAGRLTPRVGMLLWGTYFETARELGLRSGFGDDRLRFVGIKLMYDGALSGGTCLCHQAYASASDGENGIQLVDRSEFDDLVREVHASGNRVCVHANGDRAITEVLDAVEAAQASNPGAGLNHRIEHCSMVDAQLLKRIHASGVTPVPFGSVIRHHGEQLEHFYGAARTAATLPHRAFLDAAITVAGSSDYPTTPPSPLLGIESMTTRALPDGRQIGPEQRITPREALEIYTVGSAHASGEAADKGRLRPGQLADFIALDTDILATEPTTIGRAQVLSTWVGAEQVWAG